MKQAQGGERARIARDSYSYIHFFMIAGIVLLALGIKKALLGQRGAAEARRRRSRCALGPALYLLGHIAFRLRNVGTLNRQRLVVAIVLAGADPARPRDRRPARAGARDRGPRRRS